MPSKLGLIAASASWALIANNPKKTDSAKNGIFSKKTDSLNFPLSKLSSVELEK